MPTSSAQTSRRRRTSVAIGHDPTYPHGRRAIRRGPQSRWWNPWVSGDRPALPHPARASTTARSTSPTASRWRRRPTPTAYAVCATPHIRHDHDVRIAELPGASPSSTRRSQAAGTRARVLLGREVAETIVERLDDASCARFARRRRALAPARAAPGPLSDSLPATVDAPRATRAALPRRPPRAPPRARPRGAAGRARRAAARWSRRPPRTSSRRRPPTGCSPSRARASCTSLQRRALLARRPAGAPVGCPGAAGRDRTGRRPSRLGRARGAAGDRGRRGHRPAVRAGPA